MLVHDLDLSTLEVGIGPDYDKDRRSSDRVEMNIEVTISDSSGNDFRATLINMSKGGALIKSKLNLLPGDNVKICHPSINAFAKVVRIEDSLGGNLAGLKMI